MGNPLGPTLANAFMCHMERKWLADCPADFKPALYRRYVDDTFLVFNSESHIALFLNYLNSKHPSIQFTFENENNNVLPFLDLKVERTISSLLPPYTASLRSPVYYQNMTHLPPKSIN